MVGWTLPEALTTLCVATLAVVLAVPSFSGALARSHLAVATNNVLGSLMVARQVAITQNTFAAFCAGNPESGCTGNWASLEWMVFVDRNRSRSFDAQDAVHSTYRLHDRHDLILTANGPFKKLVVFVPTGGAETATGAFAAGRVRVCSAKVGAGNANDLVVIGSGRAVIEPHDFSGKCPVAGSR